MLRCGLVSAEPYGHEIGQVIRQFDVMCPKESLHRQQIQGALNMALGREVQSVEYGTYRDASDVENGLYASSIEFDFELRLRFRPEFDLYLFCSDITDEISIVASDTSSHLTGRLRYVAFESDRIWRKVLGTKLLSYDALGWSSTPTFIRLSFATDSILLEAKDFNDHYNDLDDAYALIVRSDEPSWREAHSAVQVLFSSANHGE
jgi:hypothetical protein